jgi:hypothetical protein
MASVEGVIRLTTLNPVFILVPSRLFALKHGATLVWGPETVDKAILHMERIVDRKSALFYPIKYTFNR